jgi:hypothetical protein
MWPGREPEKRDGDRKCDGLRSQIKKLIFEKNLISPLGTSRRQK